MQTLEIQIVSLLLPAMHNISLATVAQVTLSLLPSASKQGIIGSLLM